MSNVPPPMRDPEPLTKEERETMIANLDTLGMLPSAEEIETLRRWVRFYEAALQAVEKELEKEEQAAGWLIDERDHREKQVTEIYHALGGTGEWSSNHDLGDEALELAERLESERSEALARVAQLESEASLSVPPGEDVTTIRGMQRINAARSERLMAGSPGWTKLEIAGELAGEVGELANLCKKLRRSEMGVRGNKLSDAELLEKAKGEAGDVLVVLMLVASKLGFDLQDAVTDAFNKKSEEMGFPERIAAAHSSSSVPASEIAKFTEFWIREAAEQWEGSKLADRLDEVIAFVRGQSSLGEGTDTEQAEDAARWKYCLENAGWRRSDERGRNDYMEIPVAKGADLSCIAFRRDAIDAARKSDRSPSVPEKDNNG